MAYLARFVPANRVLTDIQFHSETHLRYSTLATQFAQSEIHSLPPPLFVDYLIYTY